MYSYTRKARLTDLDRIMEIIEQAKAYLQQQGSPQWQDGYGPNRDTIEQDIKKNEGCVLIYEGNVCGYSALVTGIDETYTNISNGQWNSDYEQYITIHRVAIDTAIRGKGLSKLFLRDLIIIARAMDYHDVRIDTHALNEIMQKVILYTGFTYKGIVNFPIPNGERNAYQILLP